MVTGTGNGAEVYVVSVRLLGMGRLMSVRLQCWKMRILIGEEFNVS